MSWLSSALRASGLNKPLKFASQAVSQPVRGIGRIARGNFEEGFGDVLSGGSKLATMYGLGSAGLGIGKALAGGAQGLIGSGGASAGAAASAVPSTSAASLASGVGSYAPSVVGSGAPQGALNLAKVGAGASGGGGGSGVFGGIGKALSATRDAIGDTASSVGRMSTPDKLLLGSTTANTLGAVMPDPGQEANERYMDAQTRSLDFRNQMDEEDRERERRREEAMSPIIRQLLEGLMSDYEGMRG